MSLVADEIRRERERKLPSEAETSAGKPDDIEGEPSMSETALVMSEGEVLPPGTRVDVCTRFDGSWSRGFEVVEAAEGGYRLRRLSDMSILPGTFPQEDVRRSRRRQGMWWY
jgi:hypothetical protein